MMSVSPPNSVGAFGGFRMTVMVMNMGDEPRPKSSGTPVHKHRRAAISQLLMSPEAWSLMSAAGF